MDDKKLRKSIQGILRYATTYDQDFNAPRIGAIDKIIQVCKQYHEEKDK
jgi:hypothetical protein